MKERKLKVDRKQLATVLQLQLMAYGFNHCSTEAINQNCSCLRGSHPWGQGKQQQQQQQQQQPVAR